MKLPPLGRITCGKSISAIKVETAIAFEGRSDARVFGVPTCGIPPIRLVPQKLKDGAEFTLSAMRVLDRDGKVYRGPIEPHERIDDEARLFERAMAWVSTGK